MEKILNDEFKEKMQRLYDSFIQSSNRAFDHSGNSNIDGTSRYGLERSSEAYEACAIFLDQSLAAAGVFIKSEIADRRKQQEKPMVKTETEYDEFEDAFYAAV